MNTKLLVIFSALILSPIAANATCGANHGKGHVQTTKGDKAHSHNCKTAGAKDAHCSKTGKEDKSKHDSAHKH